MDTPTPQANSDAAINTAEGQKQQVMKQSEGERQKKVNEAEGQVAAIFAVTTATGIVGYDKNLGFVPSGFRWA